MLFTLAGAEGNLGVSAGFSRRAGTENDSAAARRSAASASEATAPLLKKSFAQVCVDVVAVGNALECSGVECAPRVRACI